MEVFSREVVETLIAAAVIAGATTVRLIQANAPIPDDEALARGVLSLVDHPKSEKAREFAKVFVDMVISSAKGRAVVREEDLN